MPTVGIDAGRFTDGQVLVVNDVVGLDTGDYRLSKRYADVDRVIEDACGEFVEAVRTGTFPAREHVYEPVDGPE